MGFKKTSAKSILLLGVISSILAAVLSLIYASTYTSAIGSDFSKVVSFPAIISASVIGCMLTALGYLLANKVWSGNKAEGLFNVCVLALSFISIIGPITLKLPLDLENPELFPGLTIPMHFFPLLSWLALKPMLIFRYSN